MAGQLYFFFPTDFYYPKPPSFTANKMSVPSIHIPKTVEQQYENVEKQPSFWRPLSFSPGRGAGSTSHAKGRVKLKEDCNHQNVLNSNLPKNGDLEFNLSWDH